MDTPTPTELMDADRETRDRNRTHALEGYIVGRVSVQRITPWRTGLKADESYTEFKLHLHHQPIHTPDDVPTQGIPASIIVPTQERDAMRTLLHDHTQPIALLGRKEYGRDFMAYEATRDMSNALELPTYGHGIRQAPPTKAPIHTLILGQDTHTSLPDTIQAMDDAMRTHPIRHIRIIDTPGPHTQALLHHARTRYPAKDTTTLSVRRLQGMDSERKAATIQHITHRTHVVGIPPTHLIQAIQSTPARAQGHTER